MHYSSFAMCVAKAHFALTISHHEGQPALLVRRQMLSARSIAADILKTPINRFEVQPASARNHSNVHKSPRV